MFCYDQMIIPNLSNDNIRFIDRRIDGSMGMKLFHVISKIFSTCSEIFTMYIYMVTDI